MVLANSAFRSRTASIRVVPRLSRKDRQTGFRSGVHQQVGQHVRLIAGVIGEDGRGEVTFALGSPGVPEDRRQWGQEPLPDGSQGLDQRRVVTGVLDHRCQKSVGDERGHGVPAVLVPGGSVIARAQAARKRFSGSAFGSSSNRHSRLSVPLVVLLQDPPDHRQFNGRGRQETVVEILGLCSVVGQQCEAGEAGTEMRTFLLVGTRQQPGEWTTGPTAVALELFDDCRDIRPCWRSSTTRPAPRPAGCHNPRSRPRCRGRSGPPGPVPGGRGPVPPAASSAAGDRSSPCDGSAPGCSPTPRPRAGAGFRAWRSTAPTGRPASVPPVPAGFHAAYGSATPATRGPDSRGSVGSTARRSAGGLSLALAVEPSGSVGVIRRSSASRMRIRSSKSLGRFA